MTIRLAHIINPVNAPAASDLMVAQPVTFASMRAAQAAVDGAVTLYWTAYPEDVPAAPAGFQATPFLTRSVLDVAAVTPPRRLPLLVDILQRLYDAADADYCIYTNVDIGLQPHFYQAVMGFIDEGLDGFVINRRTISTQFTDPADLPRMITQTGAPHRGWDCFVFRRAIIPDLILGHLCLGAARIGLGMYANILATAGCFHEFKDEHLTFHLGDDRAWRRGGRSPYTDHNTREVMDVLAALEARHGPFARDTAPGAFLHRMRRFGPLYEWWAHRALLPADWAHRVNGWLGRDDG